MAIFVGQLTFEANQHTAPDGGRCADAQKLEACVARKKALKKQLGKEKKASSVAVGAKPGGTRAVSAKHSGTQVSAVTGTRVRDTSRRRRRGVGSHRLERTRAKLCLIADA